MRKFFSYSPIHSLGMSGTTTDTVRSHLDYVTIRDNFLGWLMCNGDRMSDWCARGDCNGYQCTHWRKRRALASLSSKRLARSDTFTFAALACFATQPQRFPCRISSCMATVKMFVAIQEPAETTLVCKYYCRWVLCGWKLSAISVHCGDWRTHFTCCVQIIRKNKLLTASFQI